MNIFGILYTGYVLEITIVILREYRGMEMKLSVENIGKIENANIEINSVTVITGYNSTGKSSVCKALYTVMDAYSDIERVWNAHLRICG